MFHFNCHKSDICSRKTSKNRPGPPDTARVHSFHQLGIASFGGIAGLLAEATTIREARSMSQPQQLSNEKTLGWLGYIGKEKLPSYMGIILPSHLGVEPTKGVGVVYKPPQIIH